MPPFPYISLIKLVLAPVLLMQGRYARRRALRMPEAQGPRHGHVSRCDRQDADHSEGRAVLKLLFIGDSTMAGVGVAHQEIALAAQTANAISSLLDRPVQWQMIAKTGARTGQLLGLTAQADLLQADILIVASGGNDALDQVKLAAFLRAYETLIETLMPQRETRLTVVSGLPPLHITPALPQPLRWFFGLCAHRLDRKLQRWCSARPDVAYLSLQWAADATRLAEDRFHPGAGQYRQWAHLIAEQIGHRLSADTLRRPFLSHQTPSPLAQLDAIL